MSNISIVDFTEPEKVNPYAEHVTALIAAGEGKALNVTVPVADLAKTKLKFAKAANAQNKTARVKGVDDSAVKADKEGVETGDVTITFTLTEKHKPRTRKNKRTESEVDAEVSAE